MRNNKPKNKPGEKVTKQEARKRAALIALYSWERGACSLMPDGTLIDRARHHYRRMNECIEGIEKDTHEAQLGACLDLLRERDIVFD